MRGRLAVAAAVAVLLAATVTLLVARGHERDAAAPPPLTTTTASSSTTTTSTTTTTTAPPRTTTSTTPPTTTTAPPTTTSTSTTTVPPSTTAPPVQVAVPVRQLPTTDPVVVLTFDAGSDVGSTAEILDVLGANGVPATFGMTGRWAEDHPDLVARMVAEGHVLMNHSYDHPSFTGASTGSGGLPRDARLEQLRRTEDAVRAAGGGELRPWFRPPYGDEDESVRADVGSAGYAYEILWTVDSLGWQGLAPADVVRRCLDGAAPGAIYLFHVGSASTDHLALQAVIDGLRSAGYGFVTVEALTS